MMSTDPDTEAATKLASWSTYICTDSGAARMRTWGCVHGQHCFTITETSMGSRVVVYLTMLSKRRRWFKGGRRVLHHESYPSLSTAYRAFERLAD